MADDENEEQRSEYRSESIIAGLLKSGVLVAAAVVLVGGVLFLIHHGTTMPSYRVFRGEPSDLRSVTGIVTHLAGGYSRAIIQFGLLVLIATPVTRVAFSTLLFAEKKDWLYVGITIYVLAVLVYSLLGAAG